MSDAGLYWAKRSVGAFSRPRDWSRVIVERVLAGEPTTVLEFGCNVGRHLDVMRELAPDVEALGVDINLPAVYAARAKGHDVLLGDEQTLRWLGHEFDIALTVSVLDHLPEPDDALCALDALASTLVLVEPWTGSEGKVAMTSDGKRANPYLYSWDYAKRLPGRVWTSTSLPISASGAGPDYRMHVATR